MNAPESIPWWRRPRRLRRQLAATLVLVALASVALAGLLNFFSARSLLDTGTEDKLSSVAFSRARAIESGLDAFLGRVAAHAADLGTVEALEDLETEYDALADETELTRAQREELTASYTEQIVEPADALDIGSISVEDVSPESSSGQYVQYHYGTANPFAGDERSELDDAGDGTAYSRAHARHHPHLRSLATDLGVNDLLLVAADNQEIVYTVDKRTDLGLALGSESQIDGPIAQALFAELPRVRIGDAVFVDFHRYIHAGGQPVLFAAVAVRNGTSLTGALVVELPIDALNNLTTADQDWPSVGLGDTGETYVVGDDHLLRSESRTWIEDPDRYLERSASERADLIAALGSPVLIQEVETRAVDKALDGNRFSGRSDNYLGDSRLSVSTPIDIAGVNWVAVSDIALDEARSPLTDFLRNLIVVLVVLLPAAALVGYLMARQLTVPVQPIVDAAAAVEQGERNPDVPDGRSDEFGDLARRLKHMATNLEERESDRAEEYKRKRTLLLAVLPPRLVDEGDGEIRDEDIVDIATAVAVTVRFDDLTAGDDDERADLRAEVATLADTIAESSGVDRIRSSANDHLFLVGVGTESDGADDALGFARDLVSGVDDLARKHGLPIATRVGVSTGPVGSGVLHEGSLSFGAWGVPIRRALAIDALASAHEILVDASTEAALVKDWPLEENSEVLGLDGDPMPVTSLRV